ncbi:MAG: class I SAM-dependent rRNA methyltransferase [Acutalibacteraceae bacterium]|nr:class I SAM-dependent rRNA methyltransferase [Acutalibacteraceae bacterium]
MKNKRNFPIATVTKKAEASIKKGHPWVYDAEITQTFGEFENGCLVDVLSQKGSYLGTGFLSEKSKIRVRILSSNANEAFSPAFWERRLKYAVDYRKTVMGDDFSCCRLIFGEADGLPGLTVDRFSDILVAQVLSYGMDKIKDMIYTTLVKILRESGEEISGLYERNDVAIRELEGLEQYKGWYEAIPHPDSSVTEICENGIKYLVDVENGQKTGFFLDQKYNRLAVSKIAKGKKVLDCFTHTGSFALNAAMGGAEKVTAVDISETAVEMARANAQRNGLDGKMEFLAADVFDLLPELEAKGGKPYDFIILDPPAFTKSRKTVKNAERGYKEINYRAMKLLPRGGYFATCSCSHFMKNDLFIKMLHDAAADAGVQLKQIEARQQACDHPVLWNVPETDYLKFYIFQVV